jgi:hypothetical protein
MLLTVANQIYTANTLPCSVNQLAGMLRSRISDFLNLPTQRRLIRFLAVEKESLPESLDHRLQELFENPAPDDKMDLIFQRIN